MEPARRNLSKREITIRALLIVLVFAVFGPLGFWLDAKLFQWKYNRMLREIPASTAP